MSLPENKKIYLLTSGTFHFSSLNQELLSLGNRVTFISDTPSKALRSIANIKMPFFLIFFRVLRNILRRYFFKSDIFEFIDYCHKNIFSKFIVQFVKRTAETNATVICSSAFSFEIFAKLKKYRPDLFLILDHGSNSLTYELRQLNKCATILNCSLSDLGVDKKKYLKSIYMFRKEVVLADEIFLLSQKSKVTISSNKYCTVRTHKSLADFKDNELFNRYRKQMVNICFVGTGSALKGMSIFLSVLLKINLPIKVTIIGTMIWSVKNRELIKKLQKSKLNLDFLGRKPKKYIQNVYNEFDFVVFPTLSDGYGLAIEEAFSTGVPILASKYAGIISTISKFKNVTVIDPLNITSFENDLRNAIKNVLYK